MSYFSRAFSSSKVLAKYLLYTTAFATVSSGCYLFYIESQLPHLPHPKKQDTILQFIEKDKLTPTKAHLKYYDLMRQIYFNRILCYSSYSSDCRRFNKKIITQMLQRYAAHPNIHNINQQSLTQENIKKNKNANKKIFDLLTTIRKQNLQNIQDYQYLIQRIRAAQSLMYTSTILELSEDKKAKIDNLFELALKFGLVFDKIRTQKDMQKFNLAKIRFPGDYLHKILYI